MKSSVMLRKEEEEEAGLRLRPLPGGTIILVYQDGLSDEDSKQSQMKTQSKEGIGTLLLL